MPLDIFKILLLRKTMRIRAVQTNGVDESYATRLIQDQIHAKNLVASLSL